MHAILRHDSPRDGRLGVTALALLAPLLAATATAQGGGFVQPVPGDASQSPVVYPFPSCGTVGFEDLPDGTPVSDQYADAFGLTFRFADGSTPVVAAQGPPATAFLGPTGSGPCWGFATSDDRALPLVTGQGDVLGCRFLTDAGGVGVPPPKLIIEVSHLLQLESISGRLLDVDSSDAWSVTAWDEDAANPLIATALIDTSTPGAGSGGAALWFLSVPAGDPRRIDRVELEFLGPPTTGGWALDDVRTCPAACLVPELAKIGFESNPQGGVFADGEEVFDQFSGPPHHVLFQFADGTRPHVAAVGAPQTAFQGPAETVSACGIGSPTSADMPNQSQPVDFGCLFLTDDGVHPGGSGLSSPLVVTYLEPVRQAGGYVLDIDCQPFSGDCDQWTITAIGAAGTPIAHPENPVVLNPPGVDGLGSRWSFDLDADIYAIELAYTGTISNPGLAFDVFYPACLPPPIESPAGR